MKEARGDGDGGGAFDASAWVRASSVVVRCSCFKVCPRAFAATALTPNPSLRRRGGQRARSRRGRRDLGDVRSPSARSRRGRRGSRDFGCAEFEACRAVDAAGAVVPGRFQVQRGQGRERAQRAGAGGRGFRRSASVVHGVNLRCERARDEGISGTSVTPVRADPRLHDFREEYRGRAVSRWCADPADGGTLVAHCRRAR